MISGAGTNLPVFEALDKISESHLRQGRSATSGPLAHSGLALQPVDGGVMRHEHEGT
jgi:hypothetical protein